VRSSIVRGGNCVIGGCQGRIEGTEEKKKTSTRKITPSRTRRSAEKRIVRQSIAVSRSQQEASEKKKKAQKRKSGKKKGSAEGTTTYGRKKRKESDAHPKKNAKRGGRYCALWGKHLAFRSPHQNRG